MLPLDSRGNHPPQLYPEARRTLLKALTYQTTVINLSAYARDERILRFFLDLSDPNEPKPLLLDASSDLNFGGTILSLTRKAIYGRRIAEALDRLFAQHPRHDAGSHDAVHLMTSLVRDAQLSWNDLDDELRRRIRQHFEVRQEDGGRVRLFL
jgi:hypothetical protein